MLFNWSEQDCQDLVNWLNSLMPGVIKFKFEFSTEMVEFLDLKIKIENGKLSTDLFIKPTNLQLYLDFLSNHPEPCKEGIVYGQALRILERCSYPEDAEKHLNDLKSKLTTRNYPEELIDRKFGQANMKERKGLIFSNRNQSPRLMTRIDSYLHTTMETPPYTNG